MDEAVNGSDTGAQLAKVSVALGVLALVAFIGLGFTVGDWWFLLGAAIGLVAVALGWTARKRLTVGASQRRLATVGMVLGAIPLVWFCAYMLVDAIVD